MPPPPLPLSSQLPHTTPGGLPLSSKHVSRGRWCPCHKRRPQVELWLTCCSSPTPGHTCASQARLCFRLEGRCREATTHPPPSGQRGSFRCRAVDRSGIDVSTVWKGEYFPVLTLHSSWPAEQPLTPLLLVRVPLAGRAHCRFQGCPLAAVLRIWTRATSCPWTGRFS